MKTIREREFIFKDVMGFNTCLLKFSTFFGLVSKYVTQKRLNHLLCSFLTKRIFTIDVNLHYKSRCRWIRPVDCCCVFTNFDLFLFSFLPKSRQESKFSSNQHRKSWNLQSRNHEWRRKTQDQMPESSYRLFQSLSKCLNRVKSYGSI